MIGHTWTISSKRFYSLRKIRNRNSFSRNKRKRGNNCHSRILKSIRFWSRKRTNWKKRKIAPLKLITWTSTLTFWTVTWKSTRTHAEKCKLSRFQHQTPSNWVRSAKANLHPYRHKNHFTSTPIAHNRRKRQKSHIFQKCRHLKTNSAILKKNGLLTRLKLKYYNSSWSKRRKEKEAKIVTFPSKYWSSATKTTWTSVLIFIDQQVADPETTVFQRAQEIWTWYWDKVTIQNNWFCQFWNQNFRPWKIGRNMGLKLNGRTYKLNLLRQAVGLKNRRTTFKIHFCHIYPLHPENRWFCLRNWKPGEIRQKFTQAYKLTNQEALNLRMIK